MSLFTDKAPGIMDRLMRDFNLSTADAAAILGNLGHESAGFEKLQEIRPTVKGSRGGYGWAQWTGPRRKAFEAYARELGLDISSDEANYRFLAYELKTTEAGAIRSVRAARGMSAKIEAFEETFERAGVKNYASRERYAALALNAYLAAKAAQSPVTAMPPPPDIPTPETHVGGSQRPGNGIWAAGGGIAGILAIIAGLAWDKIEAFFGNLF